MRVEFLAALQVQLRSSVLRYSAVSLLMVATFAPSSLEAQSRPPDTAAKEADATKDAASLRGPLRSLLVDGLPQERALQNRLGEPQELIPVTIRCADAAQVAAELSAMSRTPANLLGEVIEAYLTREEILSLSQHQAVLSLELVEEEAARVVSQGQAVHHAANWNAGGYSGDGVKVGIIDPSFVGIRALMGTELPGNIVGRCYQAIGVFSPNLADCERSSSHGTAVAESLIDIAPSVALYVANPVSKVDFATTVSWMVAQGVRVINYSAARPWDGPGDGTSPFSDTHWQR